VEGLDLSLEAEHPQFIGSPEHPQAFFDFVEPVVTSGIPWPGRPGNSGEPSKCKGVTKTPLVSARSGGRRGGGVTPDWDVVSIRSHFIRSGDPLYKNLQILLYYAHLMYIRTEN